MILTFGIIRLTGQNETEIAIENCCWESLNLREYGHFFVPLVMVVFLFRRCSGPNGKMPYSLDFLTSVSTVLGITAKIIGALAYTSLHFSGIHNPGC